MAFDKAVQLVLIVTIMAVTAGIVVTVTVLLGAGEDDDPTQSPTLLPTLSPSWAPSCLPSAAPSYSPSTAPSREPSPYPTLRPSTSPSNNSERPSQSPTLSPTKHPTTPPTACPSSQPTITDTQIISASFDDGLDSFSFLPDTFRASTSGTNAQGIWVSGNLQIDLTTSGASGGWERTFSLSQTVPIRLSFRHRIRLVSATTQQVGQVMASINGNLMGQAPFDFVSQLVGNGSSRVTDWKEFSVSLVLSAGTHTLVLGGWSQASNTQILIDNVVLEMEEASDDPTAAPKKALSRLTVEAYTENIRILADFGDRTQGSTSYNNAAAWVRNELEALNYVVEEHFYTYRGQSRSSLYVTKVGTKFPDRMFIVSAHLDGRGNGGAADDDASGSSLVLEMARMLGASDVTTEISVRFVFWNNEETGLNGSRAYVGDRESLQGQESPLGSGQYPEPSWLGMIQHDMILFDHGLPPQDRQIADADADIEYRYGTVFADQSRQLANALKEGNEKYALYYPAEVTNEMRNTDSVPFQDMAPSVSLRENRRGAEIGNGAQPHWHQPTDLFTTYRDEDYLFGFNILQTTAGTIAELVGLQVEGLIP